MKLFILLLMFTCSVFAQSEEEVVKVNAERIAKGNLIVDTHIDLPLRLLRYRHDVSGLITHGHFDYVRGMQGGLNAAFMSIYIPASLEMNGAKERADTLIALVEEMATKHPDRFALLNSTSTLTDNYSRDILYLPMGMENGAPLEGELKTLTYFYNKGIRYITLCHTKNNHICDSSGEPEKKWNGLSPFGEEVVKEMNRLGIMVDVSHVSDSTFYDVIRLSKAPVIASHSGCRAFTPGFERNMSDEMIKALAENGGVIQIYFGSTLLNDELRLKYDKRSGARESFFKDNEGLGQDEIRKRFNEEYPLKQGPIEDVVKHIEHVINLVGIDHVGIGSDYDGLDILAEGLEDASKYPNLIAALLKRGHSEEDIRKILSGNIMKVWREVEELAKK